VLSSLDWFTISYFLW